MLFFFLVAVSLHANTEKKISVKKGYVKVKIGKKKKKIPVFRGVKSVQVQPASSENALSITYTISTKSYEAGEKLVKKIKAFYIKKRFVRKFKIESGMEGPSTFVAKYRGRTISIQQMDAIFVHIRLKK